MKIAIVTSGRFHVCDLARELSRLGHDVRFYSLVPPWRTRKFGLPKECNRWMLPRIPYAATRAWMSRNHLSGQRAIDQLIGSFDRAVAAAIEPCDVTIGMSGMCNRIGSVVKRKFGAQLWIERGSRHILSQAHILARLSEVGKVSDQAIERELVDYDQADTISVLSKHCEESFLEYDVPASKLFRNPLGVDLSMFSATEAPPQSPPRIIMAGTWCMRKGCDVLVEAWRKSESGAQLWHVGPVTDCPLPHDNTFIHHDRVDQAELRRFYSQSHVFALASREEGLATVQPQAIACGLRLVCTTRTGGEDLGDMLSDKSIVRVVPPDDADRLAIALKSSLDDCRRDAGIRNRLSDSERFSLSWQGYGKRYSEHLLKLSSIVV